MSKLITAMVTIFKDDLSVDYDACVNLALFLLDNGSDALVVSGTTGESPTLTDTEKLKLFAIIKEAVGDKAKVIAGTGTNCTEDTVKLTMDCEKSEVDGVMLVAPYYNKPPQAGLLRHFQTIAEATELPIILYNVPSRTGINIEADTVIQLAQTSNIRAVKEASYNQEQVKRIISETDDEFKVYSGNDDNTLNIMKSGGDGVISVASHLIGPQIKQMLNFCDEGNLEKASSLNEKLMPIFKGLFNTTNPILVKAGLELIGQRGGHLRLPLIEATADQKKDLERLLISGGVALSRNQRLETRD